MNRYILLFACCMMSCRLPRIAFTEPDLNPDYVKQLTVLAGGYKGDRLVDPLNRSVEPGDTAFSSCQTFACTLEDAFTVRNGLVEETIVPSGIQQSAPPEALVGHRYRLFLTIMGDKPGGLAVFLPAVFDASNSCVRIGPAWIGGWFAGEFNFYKTLHYLAGKSGTGYWHYDRRENEDRRTGGIELQGMGGTLRKLSVRFVTDRVEDIAGLDSFQVIRIFRRSPSQIGADKGVLFDLPAIFRDSTALRFVRMDRGGDLGERNR